MFTPLLPQRLDNAYRGQRLALWLFGLVLLMKSAMSLNSIFNSYFVASSADGIPLDTYPAGAAGTIAALFALLGLSHAVVCLLGVVALVRYRSLIPLLFVLFLLEHLSKTVILYFRPIERIGAPPASIINLILLSLLVIGLGLSLWSRDRAGAAGTG